MVSRRGGGGNRAKEQELLPVVWITHSYTHRVRSGVREPGESITCAAGVAAEREQVQCGSQSIMLTISTGTRQSAPFRCPPSPWAGDPFIRNFTSPQSRRHFPPWWPEFVSDGCGSQGSGELKAPEAPGLAEGSLRTAMRLNTLTPAVICM